MKAQLAELTARQAQLTRAIGELEAGHSGAGKRERGDASADMDFGALHGTDLSGLLGLCLFSSSFVVLLLVIENQRIEDEGRRRGRAR